jgi:error-prone DNA polymerase
MRYLEFAVTSNFSFLRGASHPEELMVQAAHAGLAGIGLCDRNSVAGVVRAHLTKREHALPLRFHPGARLVFADGTPDILAYPRDRAGWSRLTRLLTVGNLRADKGECILHFDDLIAHVFGLELVVMEQSSFRDTREARGPGIHTPQRCGVWIPGSRPAAAPRNDILRLRSAAPNRVRLAATMHYHGRDRARLAQRLALAREAGVPLIAINDVMMHHHDRRELADVLTCIREKLVIDRAGRKLAVNAERHLKSPAEMARLFRDAPEAIEETARLSDELTFSLDELRYEYPDEQIDGFASPLEALKALTYQGAAQRYPDGIPDKIRRIIEHELALIAQRQYEPYFLTVYDIVRYARSQNILCQGRGSAANSTVCYCLGITEVDPEKIDLLFERFISSERDEPPDIDVDFEHARREEVIQYIYRKYGRERAGIAATVISYRGRSAIREVGKAFGLSEDTIGALASSIWGGGGGAVSCDSVKRSGLDPHSPRMRKIAALASAINGFPRHLSQHVGGFVITRSRLDEVVPIGNGAMPGRTFIEWDKDDLDALKILKVDVLGLGMLSCIRKALDLLGKHYPGALNTNSAVMPREGGASSAHDNRLAMSAGSSACADNDARRLDLSSIPSEDSAVYRMLSRADSLGVFQVESRAQMTMLPRLRPKKFYDLIIEVAIVRPGPIQGDMVHPYLRRREGKEPVDYPSPELEAILSKTMGVPLFQEQAMKIAIVAGGFTPGEADKLRRAMATFKRTGTIGTFRDKMIAGMVKKNYPHEFAERCFKQIEGFGEYGFPESHAASFALLVYTSAWFKCRYPDVFAAALLNAQPMGFYAPAQIVRDAREHGVKVRPPDINFSDWDATLEPGTRATEHLHDLHREMGDDIWTTHAIRLGLREIKGLKEADAQVIVAMRRHPEVRGDEVAEPRRMVAPSSFEGGLRPPPQDDGNYDSIRDLWLRTGLSPRVLERLADADAFGSLGLSRRDALWVVKALGRVGDRDDDLPLFASARAPDQRCTASGASEPDIHLPPMPIGEEVVSDYRFLRLSLRAHPAQFLRVDLSARRIIKNDTLRTLAKGAPAKVSGLVTCRQRPGSANGVIFMTIEDESAMANIIVWPKVFERLRPIVLGARYVAVRGPVQRESEVIHVVAEDIEDLTPLLERLSETATDIHALARCDEVRRPVEELRDARAQGGRESRLVRLVREIPELAADLDVPARGSAHAPTRRAATNPGSRRRGQH